MCVCNCPLTTIIVLSIILFIPTIYNVHDYYCKCCAIDQGPFQSRASDHLIRHPSVCVLLLCVLVICCVCVQFSDLQSVVQTARNMLAKTQHESSLSHSPAGRDNIHCIHYVCVSHKYTIMFVYLYQISTYLSLM